MRRVFAVSVAAFVLGVVAVLELERRLAVRLADALNGRTATGRKGDA